MPAWNVVLPRQWHDSVTLMRLTRDLGARPGIRRAAAMMATPPNRQLLADAGLLTAEGESAGPTDLVVAVVADTEDAARDAAAAARVALGQAFAGAATAAPSRPRTLAAALARRPEASLALVSVPGLFAGAEARKALLAGLDVMLFSDNVPLEVEIELKRLAHERDRILMGPDCGTAILGGVPLGFANVVPRGRIGIAAASGTGLQEVACLIAAAGEGVSHAIGVGGRDLSDEVGGASMQQVLAALAADVGTAVVCVIGKPPGPRVAAMLRAAVERIGKPCVVHFVGGAASTPAAGAPTRTLEDAARTAVALARGENPMWVASSMSDAELEERVATASRGLAPGQRFVRGLYAGGTLAVEARALLAASLDDVAPGVTGGGKGHRVIDLGDDVFTVGRPHPMIDGTVRREWILAEAADPTTAVLLVDVVLGHGAHPDPAGELLPALAAARTDARRRGGDLAMVATVVGTDHDPQPRRTQIGRLTEAGVVVMPSSAQAARLAARIAARAGAGPAPDGLRR